MTREEAKALKWFILDLRDKQTVRLFENGIDKIYNDFEVFIEEFANKITRAIYNCKDRETAKNVYKTIDSFMRK